MTPITDERPDPERGGGTRLDPERAGGIEPVDLARSGGKRVVPERRGDKPVDPRRQGHKAVEIDRGSVGLGRQGVEDLHPERDSVNGGAPPRGGMDSELLKDSDLARDATKDADLPGGASKVADLSSGAPKDDNHIPDGSRFKSGDPQRFPEEDPSQKMGTTAPAAESHNSAPRPKVWRRFPAPRSGDPKSLAKAVMKQIADLLQSPDPEDLTTYKFRGFRSRPRRVRMPGPMSHPRSRYREIGWTSTGRGWNSYSLLNRSEVKVLKKELKEAAEAFNRASKCFNTTTAELKGEHEKLTKIIEQYAEVVKAGIDSEVAMVNISKENAAELKALVEELTHAVKSLKSGKSPSPTDFQKFFISHGSKTCRRLTFFALTATAVLFAVGCIDFDPAPFDPKLTKAGKLLYDDYLFGLKVESTSSVATDKFTSMLSGQLNALQSKVMIERIQEKWSCELAVLPGLDATVKAGILDIWGKGLKIDVNLPIYDGQQRKIELEKKYIFGSVGGALGLNANPLLSLNTKFGTNQLSGGVIVDYDILPRLVRRIAVGGVFNLFGASGSLMMERITNLQAAGQQQPPQPAVDHQVTGTLFVQASEATAVGAEITYRLEAQPHAQVTTVAVGVEHVVDSTTSVKCKLTNQLHLTALMQHRVGDKSLLSLTGMVDMANLEALPRLGLSFTYAA